MPDSIQSIRPKRLLLATDTHGRTQTIWFFFTAEALSALRGFLFFPFGRIICARLERSGRNTFLGHFAFKVGGDVVDGIEVFGDQFFVLNRDSKVLFKEGDQF